MLLETRPASPALKAATAAAAAAAAAGPSAENERCLLDMRTVRMSWEAVVVPSCDLRLVGSGRETPRAMARSRANLEAYKGGPQERQPLGNGDERAGQDDDETYRAAFAPWGKTEEEH